ncbi:MAG: pseudouridine synthase [Eubacterium sp.]|nr:pseudouridine synthase [Eubacterium sp.]
MKRLKKRDEKEIRLNKFLSDAGVCSRREGDRMIEMGRVHVNGRVGALGDKVKPSDKITVDGLEVNLEEEQIVIAFNKPVGIECTSDLSNPDNITDAIGYPKRIYPIGRLDKNSQGLILLTNDGSLVNGILKASNYHEKEYVVHVDKEVTDEFVLKMSEGVEIDVPDADSFKRMKTRKCDVERIGKHDFKIILTQGLNRQIRRMCEELGYSVQKLKRIRVMNVELGNLPVGAYRDLTDEEVAGLEKE